MGIFWAITSFVLLCAIVSGPIYLYGILNNGGWIMHKHDTPVTIDGSWLTGEYRVCEMAVQNIWTFKDIPIEDRRLSCTVTEHSNPFTQSHILPVRYFGRLDRSGKWTVDWRCQREDTALICKAID